jgi:hypothetical protein
MYIVICYVEKQFGNLTVITTSEFLSIQWAQSAHTDPRGRLGEGKVTPWSFCIKLLFYCVSEYKVLITFRCEREDVSK